MLVTVHLSATGVAACEMDSAGRRTRRGRGDTIDAALADLGASPNRVIAADEAVAPRGAAVAVIDMISLESAERALLLAGADVGVSVCVNDDRTDSERVEALVEAVPDIVLLAGGTDGGDIDRLESMARVIAEAREGIVALRGKEPPVVFAGNPEAWNQVAPILGESLEGVANVRPACEAENLGLAVVRLSLRGTVGRAADGFPSIPAAPAGSARSAAVYEMARRFEQRTLLLADTERGAEAVSYLDGGWSREIGTDLEHAVALHRARARELSGVPLLREIADAFANYHRGRDLLDTAPPELLVGAGPAFDRLGADEAALRLVDLARPRGTTRLVRADLAEITQLGLAALDGRHPERLAFESALEDLAVVISLDGEADDVEVDIGGDVTEVPAGEIRFYEIGPGAGESRIQPLRGGDLGGGRGRAVLPDRVPGDRIVIDARGTPVPPRRRVRILAR